MLSREGRFIGMPFAGSLGRAIVAVAGLGLLASCAVAPTSTKTKFSEAAYGVKASPRVVASGRPVPKGGGHTMVGEPYRVAGRTYVPRDDPNYSKVGLASWYGPNFHGRRTANGEVFDMNDLTAAHPTLPLPSYARVTNLSNGRSVIVRVNDRGPFSRDRIIDVSATAAAMLDFERAGVARVKVDYVGPARMDGHDHDMLMASYRAPGQTTGTMVASRQPTPQRQPVVVAAARRPQPSGTAPTAVSTAFDDPIGPLILRSGFVSSYAESSHFTPAHAAAAALAGGDQPASGPAAAVDRLRAPVVSTTIQLGAFSDSGNAERVRAQFARFGAVSLTDRAGNAGTLHVVRVVLNDPDVAPETVIHAAAAAGLAGAFVVSR
jgi:peptidoglycan lytic transglycosylase